MACTGVPHIVNLILALEPKFHADWSKKKDEIGGCALITYIYIVITIYCFFRFLDVTNASYMPHLIRNLILMIMFFTELFYLVFVKIVFML